MMKVGRLVGLMGLSDSEAKGNISSTGQAKKQQEGGWKKFHPGSLIGVFDLYILQKRRSWGKFRPGVIKTSKYVYLFCYPGGLGEISPRSGKTGK